MGDAGSMVAPSTAQSHTYDTIDDNPNASHRNTYLEIVPDTVPVSAETDERNPAAGYENSSFRPDSTAGEYEFTPGGYEELNRVQHQNTRNFLERFYEKLKTK